MPSPSTRQRAQQAYEAHAAIMRQTAATPALLDNPYWTMLRQDAFERAMVEIEAVR